MTAFQIRRQTFLLLLLIFFFSSSFSQKNGSFFGFKGGASFPLGKYKSTNLDEGSFALTGYNIAAEGAWFFKPKFGVGAQGGIQQHPVDVGWLGWEILQSNSALEDMYIRSEAHLVLTGLAGIYFQQPVWNKFLIESKLLGGIMYGKTPYQLYKPEYVEDGPDFYEKTSATDWNFTFLMGIGIQYEITPCYSFILDADFNYSNLAYSFITATGTRIDQRNYMFINTQLGIRIKI